MKVNKKGIDFLHSFEGCKLSPYICPAGVPTIGWGNTFYPNGKKVTMRDRRITQEEADTIFKFVLGLFEKDVTKLLKVEVTQNQFNALVSFAYNVGSDIDQDDIPEGLGDSTLLKKVNSNPDDLSIAQEFAKWNKSGGVVMPGLVRRRQKEAEMYFTR